MENIITENDRNEIMSLLAFKTQLKEQMRKEELENEKATQSFGINPNSIRFSNSRRKY